MLPFLEKFFEMLLVADAASLLTIAYLRWSDGRWYKLHPGAEERFAAAEEELEARGL